MTDEQFSRWKDFATRMAEHCYPASTEKRKAKILEEVKEYFWWRHYQEDWKEIADWDGNGDDYFLGGQVDDFFEKYTHYSRRKDTYTGRLFSQITCCIRAGFDVAVEPSGGVLGFTAGDVRRMWAGDVPNWVKGWFEDPFDSFPDDEALWL